MEKNDKEDLSSYTREELVDEIRKLRLHVKQLRNVIQKSNNLSDDEPDRKRRRKEEKHFDFSRHPRRHVALKFAYLGWDYQGLASQEDSGETIEAHLFKALLKTKLIESRETSNYSRCGRTDKGVSAFEQVVSLNLRCKQRSGVGVIPSLDTSTVSDGTDEEEINYSRLLNQVLPKEIRVTAWAPVECSFSARYDCLQRTYYYFFPAAGLDIPKMKEAGRVLIGSHDFRNLCKLEKNGKKSTEREILDVEICVSSRPDEDELRKMLFVRIKGKSFIWHQIRCIVALLLLIGKGLEEPSLILHLLDINKQPKKPQYSMAVDFPLVLFETDHGELDWKYDAQNIAGVLRDLNREWTENAIRSSMILEMTRRIGSNDSSSRFDILDILVMGTKPKIHQPILSRPVCERTPGSK